MWADFDNPQKFNGHKSHCKVHLGDIKFENRRNQLNEARQLLVSKFENLRKQSDQTWIFEQHSCEKCGKIMTEKVGSGRFCSRSCANGRPHSEESKKKTSKSLYESKEKQHIKFVSIYERNKSCCVICNKPLSYENRERVTCGEDCLHKLLSKKRSDTIKYKGVSSSVRSNYKYGTYKGMQCDSSWELAFVLYNMDHNIPFKRNKTEYFLYSFEGKTRKFFPDFVINGTYYEIKSFRSEITTAKINCFPKDKKLVVLFPEDMKTYLDYVIDKYGSSYIYLYDDNHPSWKHSMHP